MAHCPLLMALSAWSLQQNSWTRPVTVSKKTSLLHPCRLHFIHLPWGACGAAPSSIACVRPQYRWAILVRRSTKTGWSHPLRAQIMLRCFLLNRPPSPCEVPWKCWVSVSGFDLFKPPKTDVNNNKGHLIPKKRHPKKVKSFYFLSSCHLIPPKRHENDIQKSKNDFSRGKKVRIFPWKISFQIYILPFINWLITMALVYRQWAAAVVIRSTPQATQSCLLSIRT